MENPKAAWNARILANNFTALNSRINMEMDKMINKRIQISKVADDR